MHKWIKALAAISVVATGLAAAPALYAHESESSGGSMMNSGMMDMMGMMGMMQQMSEMMEGCGKMMQSSSPGSSERPNEQWRKGVPQDGRMPGTNG